MIRITIPDANGQSTVIGRPGALPAGAQAVAVRRGNFFITPYQATVAGDKSFSFAAGGGVDRISTSDLIDLQVIDSVSRAVIAVIPLTPFVTADGNGFIAPAGVTTKFTAADGSTVTVPAGAFDAPTSSLRRNHDLRPSAAEVRAGRYNRKSSQVRMQPITAP